MSGAFNTGGIYMEPQEAGSQLLVDAYGDGGFRLAGKRVDGSVLVSENGFFPVDVSEVASLTEAHFTALDAEIGKAEILLIGTGEKMSLLPGHLRKRLQAAGIGFELMDTGAAARTFNVLRMEDRRVAALLIQIP